jgi:hypothetical protein
VSIKAWTDTIPLTERNILMLATEQKKHIAMCERRNAGPKNAEKNRNERQQSRSIANGSTTNKCSNKRDRTSHE